MTPIGSVGKVGAIESFDDSPTKPLKGLMGLVDLLAYGRDELALEAAQALRSKCDATVHKIAIKDEDDGGPD